MVYVYEGFFVVFTGVSGDCGSYISSEAHPGGLFYKQARAGEGRVPADIHVLLLNLLPPGLLYIQNKGNWAYSYILNI